MGEERGCPSTQGAAGLRVLSRSWADPPGPQIVPGTKECVRVELGFTPVWPSLQPPVGPPSPQSWAILLTSSPLRVCLLKEEPLSSPSVWCCPPAWVSSSPHGHMAPHPCKIQLQGQRASSGRATLTSSPSPGPRLLAHFPASPGPLVMSGDS